MIVVGIRVKPHDVTFAILDTEGCRLINVEKIKIPKALAIPDALKYVRNNILDILHEYSAERAGVRVTESNSQHKNIRRIELEGVIQESFASSTLESYYCGQISNISKLIGINRTEFKPIVDGTRDFTRVENWMSLTTTEQRESVLVALGAEND